MGVGGYGKMGRERCFRLAGEGYGYVKSVHCCTWEDGVSKKEEEVCQSGERGHVRVGREGYVRE